MLGFILFATISWLVSSLPLSLQSNRLNETMEMFLTNANNPALFKLVEEASGVYREPDLLTYREKALNSEKTIVITATNHGFLNHLYNFDCFMQRIHFKYLVLAIDEKAYLTLKTHDHIPVFYDPIVQGAEENLLYQSKHYLWVTKLKFAFVLITMQMGYNVLFIDTDVAVVRNPLPYLLWKNVDYVFASDSVCNS